MTRSWNRIVAADDPGISELHADGVVTQGISVAMCDDDIEATRTGYKCINCYENLDHAFPVLCPVCEFPMKACQAEKFAYVYRGWKHSGPQINWDAEAERLERREQERVRASRSSIVIPRSI